MDSMKSSRYTLTFDTSAVYNCGVLRILEVYASGLLGNLSPRAYGGGGIRNCIKQMVNVVGINVHGSQRNLF